MSNNNNNDMAETKLSPVNQMFTGRSVFITGASGFIGRVLLEKLLRSYQGIEKVYILLRAKRNMQPQERLHRQVLKAPIFDKIRSMKNGQELLDKIVTVNGDIGEKDLGISEADMQMMVNDKTLSIVYHSAATVKFDEPLKTAIKFNLIATKSMIELCKKLPNLICLCHVSTAYANSDIKGDRIIEEKLYPMKQLPGQMMKLANNMDEDTLQLIKPNLIGDRPNTYTYTKALAEHLIALEASELPVAIVRPSIVTATWKDPMVGWVDNLNGPTGLILAVGKGLLRSMHVMKEAKADVIPCDVVVNTMIAASYYAAKTSNKLPNDEKVALNASPIENVSEKAKLSAQPTSVEQELVNKKFSSNSKDETPADKKEPPIFHCTSGDVNPITWGWMETGVFPIIKKYPSQQVLRYPFGTFKSNKYHDFVTRLFVHYLPALIIDLICLVLGRKRMLLSIYYKLHCAVGALNSFASRNFNFSSKNMGLLQACLTDESDKKELFMDISSLDYHDYFRDYVLGARRYLLKESDDTLEISRKSFRKAYYIEIGLRALMLFLAAVCCFPIITKFGPCYSSVESYIST
jgi:fatty acyl-CoA reductase